MIEQDPVAASIEGPTAPVFGTFERGGPPPSTPEGNPLSWDEARALTSAMADTGSGGNADKLFEDAVASARVCASASG